MFVLALAHTFPFIIMHIKKGDMMKQWSTSFTYWTGVAAIIPQGWLTLMSLGPIRNRYYEFFKTTHRLAALSFVGFFFIHCDYRLTSWDYFIATGALYLTPLVYSQLRTYFQYGFFHRARLTLLEGNMLKISGPIFQSNAKPLNISWTPGQHIFIRFPSLGLHGLTSHPFIISCLPPSHSKNTVAKAEDTELIFYLKPMKGITARLAALASKAPNITVPILLDGPYGGLTIKTFAKFDRVLLIAGGAGAGFTLPLIEDILRHQHTTSPSQRLTKIHVIISTKHTAIKDWYQKELDYLRRYIAPSPTDPDNDGAEDILTSSIYVSSIEPPQRIIVSPYPVSTTSAGQLYNWPSDFQKVWSHRCPTSINEYQNSKMPIEERADDEERVNFIRSNSMRSNSMRSNSMRRAYTASPTYGRRGTQSAAGTYSTTTDRESYCTRATHNNNNNNNNKNNNSNNNNNLTYIISTQTTLPPKTQSPLSGRPDLKALIRDLTAGQGESVGIAVCGPAGMCFDVKNAAAEAQVRVLRGEGAREVYLHSEIFG
ncbi:hypothetical protein EG327_000710 [Venturia inaequalis]|uniref:FAD-binding FR-type domain-containing protein n=1 Tax=Venturia inaequalis TaxID=5025 RepID=A0A8H3Z9S4_VENIN|nr:hypothetical protein EG327_000710 [Venturia inaequalis]